MTKKSGLKKSLEGLIEIVVKSEPPSQEPVFKMPLPVEESCRQANDYSFIIG